jgi:hypothetical protein
VLDLIDQLAGLRAEFPAYTFTITQTWHGVSIVAARTGAGDGPLVVITADVHELRESLSPAADLSGESPARS